MIEAEEEVVNWAGSGWLGLLIPNDDTTLNAIYTDINT